MSEDRFERLEDLLRALPLVEPGEQLDERMAPLWRAQPVRRRRWRAMAWAAAAAAVAATLLLMIHPLWQQPTSQGPGAGPSEPLAAARAPSTAEVVAHSSAGGVQIERTWSTIYSKDIVKTEDGRAMERVQREVVRQVEWIDSKNQACIEWTIPTHETDLVPLEYN